MAARKATQRTRNGGRRPSGTRATKGPGDRTFDPDAPYPPAVVVLSGGAPNGALTGGALAAIYRGGKTFSTLYTSGAGALIGMLFKAPKGRDESGKPLRPDQALERLINFGIDDDLYRLFPVGYKTFFKGGPFTPLWIKAAQLVKISNPVLRGTRLFNDLVDFGFALTCPTTVNYLSKGLCAHPPFVENFVDFRELNRRDTPGQFYMNAYCVENGSMIEFSKKNSALTPRHLNASLSYPFIYAPTRIGNRHYFEGGCFDPLNLTALADHIEANEILARTVVLVDILGPLKKSLVRVPRNLWDAYGISIMMPIVALAEKNEELFRRRINRINRTRPPRWKIRIVEINFEIEPAHGPYLTDWSRGNLEKCFQIGLDAGNKFLAGNVTDLPDHDRDTSEPVPTPWVHKDVQEPAGLLDDLDDALDAVRTSVLNNAPIPANLKPLLQQWLQNA